MLLAHKAIWRPSGRELFIADLHLGKAEVFQACGIPLPSDGDRGTFERLEWLCEHVLRPTAFASPALLLPLAVCVP